MDDDKTLASVNDMSPRQLRMYALQCAIDARQPHDNDMSIIGAADKYLAFLDPKPTE